MRPAGLHPVGRFLSFLALPCRLPLPASSVQSADHPQLKRRKDMSRLGLNYIEVGKLMEEFFPEHDIRLVTISDGIDTAEGENELTPIRSLFNEWYARDISNKFHFHFNHDSGEGRELEMQMELLRRWAAENGYTVAGGTAEVGSGIQTGRPGLAEVARAVRSKKMDTVVVKDLSRLTRDYIAVEQYISFLQAEDMEPVSIHDGLYIHTIHALAGCFRA